MSKLVKKAIETIKLPDIHMEKNYKLARVFSNFFHHTLLKRRYKMWDYDVNIDTHEVKVRIFSPKKEGIYPIIIYYHGGGWVTGNINSYTKTCAHLSELTGHIVVAIDYRLAPEYPFPAGFNDCYEVTKLIYKRPGLFYTKTSDITIMGDSAGGNIAAAISQKAKDTKDFIVKKQILIYPAVDNDHSENSPYASSHLYKDSPTLSRKLVTEYIDLYKSKNADKKNPYFSPIKAQEFKNLPKTLIITAELDVLRDEAEHYGELLKRDHNEVTITRIPEVGHGFFSIAVMTPSIKKSYDEIIPFLEGE